MGSVCSSEMSVIPYQTITQDYNIELGSYNGKSARNFHKSASTMESTYMQAYCRWIHVFSWTRKWRKPMDTVATRTNFSCPSAVHSSKRVMAINARHTNRDWFRIWSLFICAFTSKIEIDEEGGGGIIYFVKDYRMENSLHFTQNQRGALEDASSSTQWPLVPLLVLRCL
jgi:hypothetical protein